MKVPPVKYLVKIEDRFLGAFIQYWVEYDKPCNLLWRKPKTDGLTAIILVVDNDDAVVFLSRAMEKLEFKLIKK